MDWRQCSVVETISGKVSGTPLILGTRIPVKAITENYEAFLNEGLSPAAAFDETADCYPSAGVHNIKAVLAFYHSHQPQSQT